MLSKLDYRTMLLVYELSGVGSVVIPKRIIRLPTFYGIQTFLGRSVIFFFGSDLVPSKFL